MSAARPTQKRPNHIKEETYFGAVKESLCTEKNELTKDPRIRQSMVMCKNLEYRNDAVSHGEKEDRDYATVSVLYQDRRTQKQFRKLYYEFSYGDKYVGKNHGEQRAWDAAKESLSIPVINESA